MVITPTGQSLCLAKQHVTQKVGFEDSEEIELLRISVSQNVMSGHPPLRGMAEIALRHTFVPVSLHETAGYRVQLRSRGLLPFVGTSYFLKQYGAIKGGYLGERKLR